MSNSSNTQKKQVHRDLISGFSGSAITYFSMSSRDNNRITVSPSSFKRIVHELRRQFGHDYILDTKVKPAFASGIQYSSYFINTKKPA